MRIYLAGKISRTDWRHELVTGLDDTLACADFSSGWPVLEKAIYGTDDYTGPFFREIEKDKSSQKVHRLCLSAVDRSDLVYAWVDEPTAYATFYELGYARGIGIPTVIAYPESFDKSEFWFQNCCADVFITAPGPITGFKVCMMRYAIQKIRVGVGPHAEKKDGSQAREDGGESRSEEARSAQG
jgi:nucleoside 2-deoxyribosyltransferase